MSVERAREQLELAEGRWQTAVKEHAQPPPDAGYARRLRALADAAAQEQAAYRYAEEEGFGWRPGPAWLPPQELRPAPWRASLAPADAWERFDEAVEALSRARTGVSVLAISQAFGQLSSAAWELADAVEKGHVSAPAARAETRGRASRCLVGDRQPWTRSRRRPSNPLSAYAPFRPGDARKPPTRSTGDRRSGIPRELGESFVSDDAGECVARSVRAASGCRDPVVSGASVRGRSGR